MNASDTSSDELLLALYRISELSHDSDNLEAFFEEAQSIIADFIYAENFYVCLYDDDNESLSFLYFADVEDDVDPQELINIPKQEFYYTLTGYMLRTGEHLHVDRKTMLDLTDKGEIVQHGKYSHEWLGIPLIRGNRVLGAVVVQTYDDSYSYSSAEIDLLRFFSRHLAIVLERKQQEVLLKKEQVRLEKHVKKRTEELAKANEELQSEVAERSKTEGLMKALYRIAMITAEAENMGEFYSILHRILGRLIQTSSMYIALKDESQQGYYFPYYTNEYYQSHDDQPHLIQRQEDEHIQAVFDAQCTLRFSHDEQRPFNRERKPMFSSWLGLPLKNEAQNTIGLLAILRYDVNNDFSDEEQHLLNYVAQQISLSRQIHKQQAELVAAHAELKAANNLLEERVTERTKELSVANADLKDVIKERIKVEEKLAHDAFHDSLTDLPNRSLFLDRLEKAMGNLNRHSKDRFSVLFLDLDRFKVVNDSLGHYIGDKLLIEVASKLTSCVRPGDTVARLGGDEFAILLLDENHHVAANSVAARIANVLSAPIELDGNTIFTSTSIGINLCEYEFKEAVEILRDADTAMYEAKSRGKAQTAVFDSSMYDRAVKQLRMESELRRALDKDQMMVFYQPIIALDSDQVIAFEALARWHHPNMGWVSPIDFIPIAEETGLISDIGLFILDKAIAQTKQWQDEMPYFANLKVSVNLSSFQLAQHDLYQDSMQIIENHQFPKQHLRLEVTESLLIDNFDSARDILNQYADAGIKILLDDFGTGYSSLSYLHQFPIHALKIDRSFVNDMEQREDNMAIISTIKTLAESLNMEVVAEGIETEQQSTLLKQLEFEYGQGYFYSKPMPADEVKLYLTQNAEAGLSR